MAFKSNEGKTSGVCRDCDQLPNVHGKCTCDKTWEEHPNHETTSDNYCAGCALDKMTADDHINGAHSNNPAPGCPHCKKD